MEPRDEESSAWRKLRLWAVWGAIYVIVALLVAAAGFFPVMILAGPHGDLMPRFLQTIMMAIYWLSIPIVPLFVVRWAKRKMNPSGADKDSKDTV